jgi:hypothetical protein
MTAQSSMKAMIPMDAARASKAGARVVSPTVAEAGGPARPLPVRGEASDVPGGGSRRRRN